MADININSELCKACGFCMAFCKHDVLTQGKEYNKLGYQYVTTAHPEQCIGCGICAIVCGESVFTINK